jgi:hypothetical protein
VFFSLWYRVGNNAEAETEQWLIKLKSTESKSPWDALSEPKKIAIGFDVWAAAICGDRAMEAVAADRRPDTPSTKQAITGDGYGRKSPNKERNGKGRGESPSLRCFFLSWYTVGDDAERRITMTSIDLVKTVIQDKLEKNSSLNQRLREELLKEAMKQQTTESLR